MKIQTTLCILLSILVIGCAEEQKPLESIRPVRVYTVNGHSAPEVRTFPGKVKATREVSLAFRIPGQIVELNVHEGDVVQKGQLLALLDQRDFEAVVADLEARILGAQSVLKEAKLNIERCKKLVADKIIAQSEFDSAQSNYETSRAQVLSLQQSLRRARLNLQYTRLEAPFDGVVAIKEVDNHEYIQAKEPIIQLEDTSSLDIVLDIPEAIWAKAFKSGDVTMGNAVATFEAYPEQEFPLTLKEFQTKANAGTQTYEVTLNMAAPNGFGIHPGMTAEVKGSMPTSSATNTVTIPISSVVGPPNGNTYVWILNSNNVMKREVSVSRITDGMIVVDRGIAQGEMVVVAGVHYLHDGQTVQILEGRIGGRE